MGDSLRLRPKGLLMKWLLRPSTLIFFSGVLALIAGWLMLRTEGADTQPQPKPVGDGEQEVVWLYAATNASAWERFVTAVSAAAQRLRARSSPWQVDVDDRNAFPPQTAAVAELTLSVRGTPGRLVFRWYKLTSEWKAQNWIRALLARHKPPVAIIGGSSSDVALDMAQQLREGGQLLGDRAPLLLVTSATTHDLTGAYPDRMFRFCFNNKRMAEAITDFIWNQGDLRPDTDPVYVAMWEDDPYSMDLIKQFYEALQWPTARSAAVTALRDLGWLAGRSAGGWYATALSWRSSQFLNNRHNLPTPQPIYSSVGSFDRPNREEAERAQSLIAELVRQPEQRRPLLVLPAQTAPSRRFLRALVRTSPHQARRFVVASGDALAFNTIYRDRNVAWPIQDLPFSLVFFCHRNPVDETAGFHPVNETPPAGRETGARGATGTEDLLLDEDIVEALLQASCPAQGSGGAFVAGATELRDRLRQTRLSEAGLTLDGQGILLFDDMGERRPGTGEHVVSLRPRFEPGGRVMPEASLAVWYWHVDDGTTGRWQRRRELPQVLYEGFAAGEMNP
jgi:hypothetical protein